MSNNIVTTMRHSTGNLEALPVVAQNSAEYPLAHCEMCIRGVTSACMSHFRCLFHLPRRSGIIIDLQLAIGMFEDNLIDHSSDDAVRRSCLGKLATTHADNIHQENVRFTPYRLKIRRYIKNIHRLCCKRLSKRGTMKLEKQRQKDGVLILRFRKAE